MSRIGKKPIDVPGNVKFSVAGRTVTVQGPKGTLRYEHRPEVAVEFKDADKKLFVKNPSDDRTNSKFHGLTRALIRNMVEGVATGFKKELEVNGVGWTAQVQGKKLKLVVGYADPRVLDIPTGVEVAVVQNKITISGADRQAVGQFAARVRSQRPPEPYNAKGIKYSDEVIARKEGKAFAGGGTA
jgi:large subunit ribosomal protein L6